MLYIALLFLLVALLAYWLGESTVGNAAVMIAKWCFVLFVVLLILSFFLSVASPSPYWGFPGRF